MEAMIDVIHLRKVFGSQYAVDDISFTVKRGEVLGFLGPNGAGKSTTMKMITGFLAPSDGEIRVGGFDVGRAPIMAKRIIGYLPEGAPAYGDMTPKSFLTFTGRMRGFSGGDLEQRIDAVVEKVHIEDVLHKPIETLSKGFKRRVGLAQAILHDPPVLIMDEPTDGLDPNQKHEVRQLIRAMAEDKAIVVSTHILEEVHAVCTRAVIIARGKLLFDGTPTELAAQSEYNNAVSLTFSGPTPDAAVKQLEALSGVASVRERTHGDGRISLLVLPHRGHTIIRDVGRLVHESDWQIDELNAETGHLDEVFRRITTQSEPVRGSLS